MKKLFSFIVAFLFTATLVSCSSVQSVESTSDSIVTPGGLTLSRVVHNSKLNEELSRLNSPKFVAFTGQLAGTAVQDLFFNADLTINSSFESAIPFGPLAQNKDGELFTLGGNCIDIFLGHTPCDQVQLIDNNGETSVKIEGLGLIDNHELSIGPDGTFWALQYVPVPCEEKPEYCGASATQEISFFEDCRVINFSSGGDLLYDWYASEHIDASQILFDSYPGLYQKQYADVFHCNSVDVNDENTKFLVSMRHLDSIFQVDISNDQLNWKIGGENLPGISLSLSGEEEKENSVLGGQHDARYLGEGKISVFDNGNNQNRPARGLIFDISETEKTASIFKVMSDPFDEKSICTGSFRPIENNKYWIAGWGCSSSGITVFDSSGNPVVSVSIPQIRENDPYLINPVGFLRTALSYRVVPVILTK